MNKNNLVAVSNGSLVIDAGNLTQNSEDIVSQITTSLSISRDILPSNEDINIALSLLPRELNLIPARLRDKFVAKSCVAISVGLFDGAIVYIWNSVIKELRNKVSSFGLEMIKNISGAKKDDNFLDKITDSELIELCYQLNIINEEGNFYLNQCREIRNNASVAHPTEIEIDDRELITFISRCCKYGLSDVHEIVGVDIKKVLTVIENQDSSEESLITLSEMILNTFESQKELIIQILYSKFIDASIASHTRSNSLELAKLLQPILSNKMKTTLIEKHNEILIRGDASSATNSRLFFENLGLLSNLKDTEKIAIFKKAIYNLQQTHWGFNNFYNERPFAERLYEISTQISPIPEIIIEEYVSTNISCYLGNSYGVAVNAKPFYQKMLFNLTPKGIECFLTNIEVEIVTYSALKYSFKKEGIESLLNHYEISSITNIEQKNKIMEIRKNYSL